MKGRVGFLNSTRIFSPSALFEAAEPGVWFDPSDLSTLYQDSAGTTPVTAPAQPVGKMLDKSGRGNHATQSTSASRPTYAIVPATGRRNLLTYSEQFDNAVWTVVNASVSPDATQAPAGTTSADKLVENTANSQHAIVVTSSSRPTINFGNYTHSIYFKAAGRTSASIYNNGTSGGAGAVFNLSTGSVSSFGGAQYVSSSIASAGNDWYRASLTFLSVGGTAALTVYLGTEFAGQTYTGDGTSGIYIWGAQTELGSTVTAYQKVVTSYEVTEANIASLSYLSFDGVDDSMVTSTITPGIDKVQVFAGVRKLVDSPQGVVAETGTSTGVFTLAAPRTGNGRRDFGLSSTGTLSSGATSGDVYPSPILTVLTGLGDIGGDLATLRVNGTQAAQSSADQGTGNYLAYPLYIGRRAGTSFPFTGNLYSLITRFGANLDNGRIAQTESWVSQKTGVGV